MYSVCAALNICASVKSPQLNAHSACIAHFPPPPPPHTHTHTCTHTHSFLSGMGDTLGIITSHQARLQVGQHSYQDCCHGSGSSLFQVCVHMVCYHSRLLHCANQCVSYYLLQLIFLLVYSDTYDHDQFHNLTACLH